MNYNENSATIWQLNHRVLMRLYPVTPSIRYFNCKILPKPEKLLDINPNNLLPNNHVMNYYDIIFR